MASIRRPGRASIFSPANEREREANFESYWLYQQRRDGEILEDAKDLSEKQKNLARFQAATVRTRRPVPDTFHRNYITMQDDPRSLDPQGEQRIRPGTVLDDPPFQPAAHWTR